MGRELIGEGSKAPGVCWEEMKPEVPVLPPLAQPIKSDAALGFGSIKILSTTNDAAAEVKHTDMVSLCLWFPQLLSEV